MADPYVVPFELTLNRTQMQHARDQGGPRDRSQLFVQVVGDSLRARWPANDTFDHPAEFTGQVGQRPGGAVIVGTIREARANILWVSLWRVPVAVTAFCLILGLTLAIVGQVHNGLPPLLIGAVGLPVFVLMLRWQRSQRRPTFERDSAMLAAGLSRYLTTGHGSRAD